MKSQLWIVRLQHPNKQVVNEHVVAHSAEFAGDAAKAVHELAIENAMAF